MSQSRSYEQLKQDALKGDSTAYAELNKKADENDARALAILGWVLQKRDDKDYPNSLLFYRRAAQHRHDGALNNLGFIYSKGIGVPVNKDQTTFAIFLAAKMGLKISANNLERLASDKTNILANCCLSILNEAKEKELPFNFRFIPENWLNASMSSFDYLRLLERAYPENDTVLTSLADCYEFGSDTECDPEKALSVLLPAAKRGNVHAMFRVANLYQNKLGGDIHSINQACHWYYEVIRSEEDRHLSNLAHQALNTLSANNRANAFQALGNCYWHGYRFSVAQSDTKAAEAFTQGAKLGDPFSMIAIGNFYKSGHGVKKNPATAARYYLQAAKTFSQGQHALNDPVALMHSFLQLDEDNPNNPTVLRSLAACYQHGYVFKQDINEARELYLEAVERCHDPEAAFELAQIDEINQKKLAAERFLGLIHGNTPLYLIHEASKKLDALIETFIRANEIHPSIFSARAKQYALGTGWMEKKPVIAAELFALAIKQRHDEVCALRNPEADIHIKSDKIINWLADLQAMLRADFDVITQLTNSRDEYLPDPKQEEQRQVALMCLRKILEGLCTDPTLFVNSQSLDAMRYAAPDVVNHLQLYLAHKQKIDAYVKRITDKLLQINQEIEYKKWRVIKWIPGVLVEGTPDGIQKIETLIKSMKVADANHVLYTFGKVCKKLNKRRLEKSSTRDPETTQFYYDKLVECWNIPFDLPTPVQETSKEKIPTVEKRDDTHTGSAIENTVYPSIYPQVYQQRPAESYTDLPPSYSEAIQQLEIQRRRQFLSTNRFVSATLMTTPAVRPVTPPPTFISDADSQTGPDPIAVPASIPEQQSAQIKEGILVDLNFDDSTGTDASSLHYPTVPTHEPYLSILSEIFPPAPQHEPVAQRGQSTSQLLLEGSRHP